jgi:hypothetical protein
VSSSTTFFTLFADDATLPTRTSAVKLGVIMQSLNRAMTRGNNRSSWRNPWHDVHQANYTEESHANLGVQHIFLTSYSRYQKGSYKGGSHLTFRGLVSELSDLGQQEARLFVSRCLQTRAMDKKHQASSTWHPIVVKRNKFCESTVLKHFAIKAFCTSRNN